MHRQRIGLLFEYTSMNGGEHSILSSLQSIHHDRFEFIAIAPSEGPLVDELKKLEIRCEVLEFRTVTGVRLPPGEFQAQLRTIIQTKHLNLIHSNSLTMGRHLGAVVSGLNIPTTCHLRDIMSLSRTAIRDLNEHCCLIAVSDATRNSHIKQGIHSERIVTCYNGIDTEKFAPRRASGELKAELKLPDDAILVATIGQICLRKAQTDFALAATQLKNQFPELHFLLIGERHSSKQESREFDAQVTQTFSEAGMSNRFHRLGYRKQMPRLYNEIDFLIHPARQEPLGRVLLEAAASGVPIVATNVGGTREILTHEESALLVAPAEPIAMAGQISRLLRSPELPAKLSQHAREHILQQFSIQKHSEKLIQIWDRNL